MILGINVKEKDYVRMTDKERLALLDDAYFRSRQMKEKAKSYEQRLIILPKKPEEVLSQKEFTFVKALWEGMFE